LKKIEHSNAVIEMACTIGHKINNPLSSLILSLKNIEEELSVKKDENLNEDMAIINQSIDRIRALTNDLIKLKDPRLVEYTPDQKMIKLD
jgi:sigma-B regulation protein RsbU (phosphoserine phosphatase)